MNELELIYNNKIVKFKFDKAIVINSNDSDFYGLLIDSIKGKNKNSLFNRREIEKNEFAVYEINGSTTLADEFKYGSKSFVLKRIQEAIESDEEEYSSIVERINDDFNEINIKLNDYLGIEVTSSAFMCSTLDIIKKLYNPIGNAELGALETEIAFYRNVFEFCNKTTSFVVLDQRESKKSFISILKLLELLDDYRNVSLILFENDMNNLFNLSLKYNVYFKDLAYCEFNACVDSFARDTDLISNASTRILLMNSLGLHQISYEDFLKNPFIDEKDIEFIRKFKKYYELKKVNNAGNIE